MAAFGEGVKLVGQDISYTPEQIREVKKCSKDIFHFLKYVKIVHPDRGRVIFEPWDYQKELFKLINGNRFVIALVARQQGKSIMVAAYLLWYSIFNADKTVGVVSNNEEGAIDILDRIKVMYEELPDWLKPGQAEYNKKTITFENGTKIRARATSKDSFRGRTLNICFADEFAFVDPQWKADEFFTSNWPTISASTESKFIIVSTPKGIGNIFHRIYTEAENKLNTFKHFYADWSAHPERDQEWADEQKKNLGERRFNQEFACVSGKTRVTIRDKQTGIIRDVTIENLYNVWLYSLGKILKDNNRYEILAPDGFKDFKGIQKLQKSVIKFVCGDVSCRVSHNHSFVVDGISVTADSMNIGDMLSHKRFGDIPITNIIKSDDQIDVYDPIDVDGGNMYYGDDIIHHNCNFLGSESTLISENILKAMLDQPIIQPIQLLGKGGCIRVYEHPKQGCQYVLGVDVAKGTGEHYSTIQAFKINSNKPVEMEQVCVFEDNMTDVYTFAGIVDRIARTYNNAFIMCENNSEGSTVVNQLWWEYENENLVCEGTKITKLGVRATTRTKPVANLLMKKLVEDGCIKIVDYNTISQFLMFLDMGNNRFGGNGNSDDLISAFYWACYFFEFDLLEETMSFKPTEHEEEDLWGVFGIDYDDVPDGYEIVKR